jgi:hypothetical protein
MPCVTPARGGIAPRRFAGGAGVVFRQNKRQPMSASSFFSSLIAGFKAVVPKIEADFKAVEPDVAMAVPVVETLFPQAAPFINEGTQVVATVSSLSTGATTTATGAIAELEEIFAKGSDEVKRIEALFGVLGTVQTAGQAIVVVPSLTAATQPVPAPGKALS